MPRQLRRLSVTALKRRSIAALKRDFINSASTVVATRALTVAAPDWGCRGSYGGGGRYEVEQKYTQFVELHSRPTFPRVWMLN